MDGLKYCERCHSTIFLTELYKYDKVSQITHCKNCREDYNKSRLCQVVHNGKVIDKAEMLTIMQSWVT